jgi:hypothetical protein
MNVNKDYLAVGSDSCAPYVAFGDDSTYGDFAAFAFVIFPRTRVSMARRKIEELKKDFKIPESCILHCRTLFNPYQREKLGVSHLDTSTLREMFTRAIKVLNQSNGRLNYATAQISELTRRLSNGIEMRPHDGSEPFQVPINVDSKSVLALLFNVCFPVVLNKANGPSAAECEIFVSEDKTKISIVGQQRKQAHSWYSGYLETGEGLQKYKPKVVASNADPLLQLADIFAYLCSHAASQEKNGNFWQQQLSRVNRSYQVG